MTGKQLKAFAARVRDDAEIEIQAHQVYPERWSALKAKDIRAVAVEVVKPEEADELRSMQTVNG